MTTIDYQSLTDLIRSWGHELGFQQIGISDVDLGEHEQHLQRWLEKNHHGDMNYMARHGSKRSRPAELVPGTLRVISARMDYLPADTQMVKVLQNPQQAYVSRYALGRDYHNLIRKRLARLGRKIEEYAGACGHRAFVDSAPVLERALAQKAGLGWIGKNTMLINSRAGSWFFLGELFTDLPLVPDEKASFHCGSCRSCLDICPTNAFTGPFELDARRCISYLTIELRTAIPEDLRPLIGNRIFGCDDCQSICPWNKFSSPTQEPDFNPRHRLDRATLVELFAWTEEEFLLHTEGSAIRRIGHECWLRNIAVALGNAPTGEAVISALQARTDHPSALVREHVIWALARHGLKPA